MIGGKWTTFRAFAEQTADAVLVELGRDRADVTRKTLPIGGGPIFGDGTRLADELVKTLGVDSTARCGSGRCLWNPRI